MASRLLALAGPLRRAGNRAALQAFARPYAANVATVADEDSFLKWTTPEPQQFVHQGILAAPETKVRLSPPPRARGRSSALASHSRRAAGLARAAPPPPPGAIAATPPAPPGAEKTLPSLALRPRAAGQPGNLRGSSPARSPVATRLSR